MKNKIAVTIILLLSFTFTAAVLFNEEPVITAEEIGILTGEKWIGDLTYLDYQTDSETKISANVTVVRSGENTDRFILILEYPKEPQANNIDTVSISDDGKNFDGEKVIEKFSFSEDSLKFITESSGMDDDKEALFRHTYEISPVSFKIRKDVKFTGESTFIKRNEFYFTR
ncbi:MAG TPA: hypothetical protein PKA90_08225 [Ignavibacteria bacterium]|nr:hypothetical protein [Ignavibacteria bacterium]HMR40404.1 hypothetical protein [Ignavibacteria bacterium]